MNKLLVKLGMTMVLALGLTACAPQKVTPWGYQTDFDTAPGLVEHDFQRLSTSLTEDMLTYPWLEGYKQRHQSAPTIHIGEIDNLTGEPLDTAAFKQAFEQALINSGQVKLIGDNKSQADFVLSGKILLELEQTEVERKATYNLEWALTNQHTSADVWAARNQVQKNQRMRPLQ